jgi:undecaprenyl-diphosphatase
MRMRLGYLIFVIFGITFALLTWQVVVHGPITRVEPAQIAALHQWARRQPEWFILLMRGFSVYGREGEALIALVLGIAWARRKARRELYMLFFGMLAGELWFQTLSVLIQRSRPVFPDPFETLNVPGYPSGHAVTTVLLAWMIFALLLPHLSSLWKRLLLIGVVLLFVGGICYSRLFLGLHYPTDVYGGIALGLTWGGLVFTLIDAYFFRKNSPRSYAPEMMPVTAEKNSPHP